MCKICSVCVGFRRGAVCLCHTAEGACPSQDSQTSRDGGYVPGDEYNPRRFHNPNPTSALASLRRALLRRARAISNARFVHSPPNIGGDVSLQLSTAQAPRLHGEHLPATSSQTETLCRAVSRATQGSRRSASKKPLQAPARIKKKRGWPPSRRTPRGPRRSTLL